MGLSGGTLAALGLLFCVVVIAIVLGVYYGKVACPTFGNKCETVDNWVGASGSGGSGSDSGSGGSGSGSGGSGSDGGNYGDDLVKDCSGRWGDCSVSCGAGGVQTYEVIQDKKNGGLDCYDDDGVTVRHAGETKVCTGLLPCGTDCVGGWENKSSPDGYGDCSVSCGTGSQTRKYIITTPQSGGGTSCPYANNYTDSKVCSQPACTGSVNCVGGWGSTGGNDAEAGWNGCSKVCDTGTQTRTYNITTLAANGGTQCPHTQGEQQTRNCNTIACCSTSSIAGWSDVGGVICPGTGSSDPNPYILQTRAVTFPSGTPTSVTATTCGLTVLQNRYTAGPDSTGNKCPDMNPISGTCSVSGMTWSASSRCHSPTATTPAIGGTCLYGGAWSTSGCAAIPDSVAPGPGNTCNPGYYYDSIMNMCNRNSTPNSAITVNCPAGGMYTADVPNNNCKAVPNMDAITLGCAASNYFTPNIQTQKCVAK